MTAICKTALASLIGLSLLLAASAGFAEPADELAQRLIVLRGQVEELSQELAILKDEHRAEMTSLANQKAELEASLNRTDTQIRQLQQQLEENRALAEEAGVNNEALKPILFTAISDARQFINAALPFKREERLAELDEIRTQVETGAIPANRAANRLWGFMEDEIRLTRENGIHSQTIELAGRRMLADVAKLGSVMMYFRTEDQRYGEVIKVGGDWDFRELHGAEEIAAVRKLFDSLQKQIRQGFFELPNTIAARAVRGGDA